MSYEELKALLARLSIHFTSPLDRLDDDNSSKGSRRTEERDTALKV